MEVPKQRLLASSGASTADNSQVYKKKYYRLNIVKWCFGPAVEAELLTREFILTSDSWSQTVVPSSG